MNTDQTSLSIEQFVDKLIAEKQLPDLGPEILDEMKKDLTSRVEDRINAALISNLDPDQMKAFTQLLDNNNESQTQEYLKKEIPNLEAVIAGALINFRETYLGLNS